MPYSVLAASSVLHPGVLLVWRLGAVLGLGWPGLAKPIICDIVSKFGRPAVRRTKTFPGIFHICLSTFWQADNYSGHCERENLLRASAFEIARHLDSFSCFLFSVFLSNEDKQKSPARLGQGPRHSYTSSPLTVCVLLSLSLGPLQRLYLTDSKTSPNRPWPQKKQWEYLAHHAMSEATHCGRPSNCDTMASDDFRH
jgi:hypothetical protein